MCLQKTRLVNIVLQLPAVPPTVPCHPRSTGDPRWAHIENIDQLLRIASDPGVVDEIRSTLEASLIVLEGGSCATWKCCPINLKCRCDVLLAS